MRYDTRYGSRNSPRKTRLPIQNSMMKPSRNDSGLFQENIRWPMSRKIFLITLHWWFSRKNQSLKSTKESRKSESSFAKLSNSMHNQSEIIHTLLQKKFTELLPSDVKTLREAWILNGFGGASQSWLARFLIWLILSDFDEAIPDMHDFSYSVWGDEARRLECDEGFYQAMLNDIRARYDRKDDGKWGLVWKSIVAVLAYDAIRWKWSRFFFYH